MIMKKSIFIIVSLFFQINLFAQHISFLGQPLGCDFATFKNHMREKHFKYKGKDRSLHVFKGEFAGEKSKLYVKLNPKTGNVFSVMVVLNNYISAPDDYIKYDDLTRKYKSLKRDYISKYGFTIYEDAEGIRWYLENKGSIGLVINTVNSYGYKGITIIYMDYDGFEDVYNDRMKDY